MDHVLAVTEAVFHDHMGHGGWFVGFDVFMAFRDAPLRFMRDLTNDEFIFRDGEHLLKMNDGSYTRRPYSMEGIVAVANMQKQADAFVELWKAERTVQ